MQNAFWKFLLSAWPERHEMDFSFISDNESDSEFGWIVLNLKKSLNVAHLDQGFRSAGYQSHV